MKVKSFSREGNIEKYIFFDGHELQYDRDTKTLKISKDGSLLWKGNFDSEDNILTFKRKFYNLVVAIYEEFEGVRSSKLHDKLSKILPSNIEIITRRPCPCQ